MDKNKALKILQLNPDATRDEAKKAFRALAKRYHPDRFARDRGGAQKAEIRMKEVNGAFHFLNTLLPPEPEPVRPKTGKTQSRPGFFSGIREKWGKRPRRKSGNPRERQETVRPKPSVKMKKKTGPVPQFETFLNALAPDAEISHSKSPKAVRGTKPYENYCRYMAAKKKIKGVRRNSQDLGIGRVEKISPVRPVNPIGSK